MKLKLFKHTHVLLLIIMCVGLFLRMYKVKEIGLVHADEFTFLFTLKAMHEASQQHGEFSREFFKTMLKPPDGAYASYGKVSRLILYYPFYHFFKTAPENYIFLSVLWSLLTLFFIYSIGKTFFNERVGLIAAFLFSISAWNIQQARTFLGHTDSCFLICVCGFYVLKRIQSPLKKRYLFLSGLPLGIGMTMHGSTGYFLPPLLVTELFMLNPNLKITTQIILTCRNLILLVFSTAFPFIAYEALGLFYAHTSYLYSFWGVSGIQIIEEVTAITPLYLLKQYGISNGHFFTLLSIVGILFTAYIFLKTKEKKYLFLCVFPSFFLLLWTLQIEILHSLFRYLFPSLPFILLCIACTIEYYLKTSKMVYLKYGLIVFMVLVSMDSLMISKSLIQSFRHSFSDIAKTIQQKEIKSFFSVNPFFCSYFKFLHPSIHCIQTATVKDIKNYLNKNKDPGYLLIEGERLTNLADFNYIKNALLRKPHDRFSMPFMIHTPYLYEIAHNTANLELLHQIKNEPLLKIIFLIPLKNADFN